MTIEHDALEAARKALAQAINMVCPSCWDKFPFTPGHYETAGSGMFRGVGEGDSQVHPRGGLIACNATFARRALASVNAALDAPEVAQDTAETPATLTVLLARLRGMQS